MTIYLLAALFALCDLCLLLCWLRERRAHRLTRRSLHLWRGRATPAPPTDWSTK